MTIDSDFNRMIVDFMSDDPLTVTYNSITSVYSDATGINTPVTLSVPCQAILLEHQLRVAGDRTQNTSLIREGDKLLYMRPPEKTDTLRLPLVLNPASDTITVAGLDYSIVTFKQTNPSAVNCVLYEIYLRR